MVILSFIKKYKYLILYIIIIFIGIGFLLYWTVGQTGNIPWYKCVIPYTFNDSFTDFEKESIKKYMNKITDASKINPNDAGIIFIPKTNEIEFITFNKTSDDLKCGDSNIGKRLGTSVINLTSNCITEQNVIHELLHSLGFNHEQQRKDRDSYVKINYDNILDDRKIQFDITTNVVSNEIILKTDYDYNSIMQYPSKAFSKNNKETIEPIKNADITFSNKELSSVDKKRLQMYYNLWR